MAVSPGRPFVFLDKDGTIVEDVPYNVDPQRMRLVQGAAAALRRLDRAGFGLAVVSNQSGVARGMFGEEAVRALGRRLIEGLAAVGVPVAGFYYCPHHPEGSVAAYAIECGCRKPAAGLVLRAAAELGADRAASWFVGDILDDVEAGRRAGCRTVLVDSGHETEWRMSPERIPDVVAPDLVAAAESITATTGPGARTPATATSAAARASAAAPLRSDGPSPRRHDGSTALATGPRTDLGDGR